MSATDVSFPRTGRLRRSWEFRRASRLARRARDRAFVVLISPSPDGQSTGGRLGLTINRRVGNAVVRNRLKRQIREWFRNAPRKARAGKDIVIIARKAAAGITTEELRSTLSNLLNERDPVAR